jgi:uncharacterized protein (TIGR02246 family)
MKSRLWYSLLLGFVIPLASIIACRPHASGTTPDDQQALATIVKEIDDAYNAQDAARFSAVFAENGNFQFPIEGISLHGRDEIRRHFAAQFANLPPMRHVTKTGEMDTIAPGVLAVDIQVDIFSSDPKTNTAQTLLCHYNGLSLGIRTDSGWRIRLVRLYPSVK